MAPGPTGLDWKAMKGGPERDETIKKYGPTALWKMYGASKIVRFSFLHLVPADHMIVCREIFLCQIYSRDIMAMSSLRARFTPGDS